ncbi:MAG: hypothetical protein WBL63_01020 [Candidatus Acidiferrum sp.]
MKPAKFAITWALLCLLLPFAAVNAGPKTKSKMLPKKQIVVSARKVNGSVEYQLGKLRYTKFVLNDAIGEMRLSANADSEIVIILEDTMALSDIKQVPQMAVSAGFQSIRIFVYWKGTGNMAELFFGPVVKHKLDNVPY